ncbi:hypothetical protein [Cronobacter sakazakii]|uniref:hypothetical protein n=1 Tax=Cronobacter sakazakii TaxID=28141 RepID=UPI0009B9B9A8|nr:hypothetical protein [Cronobacter sakazakii]
MRPLMPPVQTPDNLFHDGNPLTGELGTIVDAEHLNNVQGAVRDAQSELITVLTAAGINVDPSKQNQLLTALKALLLSRSSPFADIKSDGAAAIATALSNLGLGAGAPAIGIPFFWPSSAMPNTVMTEWADMVFLKFNGATFSATTYPKLALVFPGLVLTESRGEFLRIWDDGRGVDAGRGLLSAQGHAYQSHSHRLLMSAGSAGSGNVIGIDGSLNGTLTYNINQPGGGQIQAIENAGGTETRPRNIAFNFLVRAK